VAHCPTLGHTEAQRIEKLFTDHIEDELQGQLGLLLILRRLQLLFEQSDSAS
jgi:hypothetical protein